MQRRLWFTNALLAIVLAGPAAMPAAAQEGPTKVLFDDGNVRVQELRYKPGAEGPSIARPVRVIRVLEGGTMQRIYPDGKSEHIPYRPGDVKVYPAEGPYRLRNVGTSDIVLYVVAIRGRP